MTPYPPNDVRQYDELVDEWDDPHGSFAMLYWLAEARAALVPPARREGDVLVDVACGGGLFAPHARSRGYRHIGVDLSRSGLEVARRRGVLTAEGDATALPIRSEVADVVVAGEVLEHVPDLPGVVAEVCRILRPGGLVVLDTIADTVFGRLSSVTVAERIPGGPPPGIHDPALFVNRRRLRDEFARYGVPLTLGGLRLPAWSYLRWAWARSRRPGPPPTVRLRTTRLTGRPLPGVRHQGGSRVTVLDRPVVIPPTRPALPQITGAGHAVPGPMDQAGLWEDFFAEHYDVGNPRTRRLARRIFASAGVTTRHGALDPRVTDVSNWTTGERMSRYVAEALPLGQKAVTGALDAAGLDAADVGLFAVVSCTGYSTPGVDILLARDLGMSTDVQRLLIGHMGCYAALPGLGAVSDFVAARGRPALLLCLELTSLHTQPATADLGQVVAHALFADAAAALVLQPGGASLEGRQEARRPFRVRDVVAVTDASTADHMTWDVTDLGFRMGLSPRVPDVLARHVGSVVRDRLLAPHGLVPDDVAAWAVHPGGRRILEVVGEQLELPAAAMAPSYDVLDRFGNCSSATVLLVLDQLPDEPGPVVAMAFGPGLTLYAALLER